MLSQKVLLRLISFYKNIKLRLKLIKKRKKYFDADCYIILRLEKLISKNKLIIMLELKKIKLLQIITIPFYGIICKAAKRFLIYYIRY